MATHTCEPYDKFITFYHLVLAQAGILKVTQTMALQFWHPGIRKQVAILVEHCECQESQKQSIGYGHLPLSQAPLVPQLLLFALYADMSPPALLSSKDC